MREDTLKVVASEDHHLVRVLQNLRRQDRVELLASGTLDPLAQFRWARENGQCWAVLLPSGAACAVGGIIPVAGSDNAAVWLMGTDELTQHWREFLRRSRAYVDALHEIRPVLFNRVHADNEIHLRWLRWAGFIILPEPCFVGNHSAVFHEFIRIRKT